MKINIEDYKKTSGKIKIGGINGYGKEYELNKLELIFKGYYKNEKKMEREQNMINIKNMKVNI